MLSADSPSEDLIESYLILPKRWGGHMLRVDSPPEDLIESYLKLPKRWGVLSEEHPQEIFFKR